MPADRLKMKVLATDSISITDYSVFEEYASRLGGGVSVVQVGGWVRVALCCIVVFGGCTRARYRQRADRDAYCIVDEKTLATPWQRPDGFEIDPDPRSRFFDPTSVDDPELPIPSPHFYDYSLPKLPSRDPARFRGAQSRASMATDVEIALRRLPATSTTSDIQQVAFLQDVAQGDPELLLSASGVGEGNDTNSLRIVPIGRESWETLPTQCLMRMFEFESVRREYEKSYQQPPESHLRDTSQRLALEDILELALINSREYQTQKEALYLVALRLSLDRFDYQLKFSPSGNGTATNFSHDRNGGITENTLSIPTTATADKVLSTGGNLLARFANDVVLTFNGPNGFAADVGSELLLSISQSVFQRDVVLERLTQAERDVVYAARDFARYRKTFFRDNAALYYQLLLAYRSIEISSQDYFSNLRAFSEGEAKFAADQIPRIQVDQFEQNSLESRSQLVRSCNSLESSLDRLKLQIGLPPEIAINVDLAELEELSLRDEASVARELMRRARRRVARVRNQSQPSHVDLVYAVRNLARQMVAFRQLEDQLHFSDSGARATSMAELELLYIQLGADEARLEVEANRKLLATELNANPPSPPLRIFHRSHELVRSSLVYGRQQLIIARQSQANSELASQLASQLEDVAQRSQQLADELIKEDAQQLLGRIGQIVADSTKLLSETDGVLARIEQMIRFKPLSQEQDLAQTLQRTDYLLSESDSLQGAGSVGLVPIRVDMDEAMLAAMARRFDLMNVRSELADSWRNIKFAGDDLRSVLNLEASQTVSTRADVNRVADFTFDESETRLAMRLDTPFNRRAQRNDYRGSLINYQQALRRLIAAEDDVKFSIREDLRDLQLDRDQYEIAVASAALARERVSTTRLQLQLGLADVKARDFLESQQAYTASLNSVAREHIGYLLDRIELFLDSELIEVNESGFWPELYDSPLQPAVSVIEASPWAPYGELPPRVKHSPEIRRMLNNPDLVFPSHKVGGEPGEEAGVEVQADR